MKIIINKELYLERISILGETIDCILTKDGYLFALIPVESFNGKKFGIEKFPIKKVPDCFKYRKDLIDRQSLLDYIHSEIKYLDDIDMVNFAYDKIIKNFPSVFE